MKHDWSDMIFWIAWAIIVLAMAWLMVNLAHLAWLFGF